MQRKSEGEHESSRRLKTQFLIEMEGCGSGSEQILLIGAWTHIFYTIVHFTALSLQLNYISIEFYDINRSCAQRQYHGKEEGCLGSVNGCSVSIHCQQNYCNVFWRKISKFPYEIPMLNLTGIPSRYFKFAGSMWSQCFCVRAIASV